MSLLRALIPSWRFFEELGPVPTLEYRVCGEAGASAGPWVRCLPEVPRRASQLFLNPRGNLSLACHGIVNRLVEEEGVSPESTTYLLARNLVRWRLRELGEPATHFQFRVRVSEGEGDPREAFVSEICAGAAE